MSTGMSSKPPVYETITLEFVDGVAVVTLNRPPVNAVNRTMQLELTAAFELISVSKEANSAVLTASGNGPFCGGIDLKEMASKEVVDKPLRATLDPGWEWRNTQAAIRHCAVPVIAAVEGATIGAGFGMVGVCDIIIASTRARFGLTEINVGLLGGASKAIKLVGPARARKMMFTGVLESAEEFYRLGAVDELVPEGNALDRALEIGRLLAGKSPLAMRLAKESILRIEGEQMETQYRTEQDYTIRMMGLDDSHEAMQAFVEKREPVWNWR